MGCVRNGQFIQQINSQTLSCASSYTQSITMTFTPTFIGGASNTLGTTEVTTVAGGAVNGFGIAYIAVSPLDRLLLSRQP